MQKCKTVEATLRYFHCLYCLSLKGLSLSALAVAAHELVHATSRIHQLALARVEGVRGVTDFQLDYWISLAFELDCLRSLCSATAEEHVAIAHVLEHNGTIVFGMQSFLHFSIFFVSPSSLPCVRKWIRDGLN